MPRLPALRRPDKPWLRVTVPNHNKDLKRRTLESIVKQAGLTNNEFRTFL